MAPINPTYTLPQTATGFTAPSRAQTPHTGQSAADSFSMESFKPLVKAIKHHRLATAFAIQQMPYLFLLGGASGCTDHAVSAENCSAPEIITRHPDIPLLSEEMKKYLTGLIQSLPADFCGSVERIEFIKDLDFEKRRKAPDEEAVQSFRQLDDAFDNLHLDHLAPNRGVFYSEADKTIYLHEGMLFHRITRVPNRHEIASAILIGYGQAFGTPARVKQLIDEIIDLKTDDVWEPIARAAIDTGEVQAQLVHLFPEIIMHYVLSGHTIRNAASQESTLAEDGKNVENPEIRFALSRLSHLFMAYGVVKESFFGGREYQTTDAYEDLARGDVGLIHAVLTEGTKSVDAPYLDPYREVALDASPDDATAFLFAGAYLLDRMHFSLSSPDQAMVETVRKSLKAQPKETEVNIAMLVGSSRAALTRLKAGEDSAQSVDAPALWDLIDMLASTQNTQYKGPNGDHPPEPIYWPEQIDGLLKGFLTDNEFAQGALSLYGGQPDLRDYFRPLIQNAKKACDQSREGILENHPAPETEIIETCGTLIEDSCQSFPELCQTPES